MAMLNNQRVPETIDFSHLWIGLRENRKPWYFSHEIWGFPAELFPLGAPSCETHLSRRGPCRFFHGRACPVRESPNLGWEKNNELDADNQT